MAATSIAAARTARKVAANRSLIGRSLNTGGAKRCGPRGAGRWISGGRERGGGASPCAGLFAWRLVRLTPRPPWGEKLEPLGGGPPPTLQRHDLPQTSKVGVFRQESSTRKRGTLWPGPGSRSWEPVS